MKTNGELAEGRSLIDGMEHLSDEISRDIVADLPRKLPLAQDVLEDWLEARRHHALGHLVVRFSLWLGRMLGGREKERQQEAVLVEEARCDAAACIEEFV